MSDDRDEEETSSTEENASKLFDLCEAEEEEEDERMKIDKFERVKRLIHIGTSPIYSKEDEVRTFDASTDVVSVRRTSIHAHLFTNTYTYFDSLGWIYSVTSCSGTRKIGLFEVIRDASESEGDGRSYRQRFDGVTSCCVQTRFARMYTGSFARDASRRHRTDVEASLGSDRDDRTRTRETQGIEKSTSRI